LDRTYVIQTAGVSSLWDLGLQLWRENVIAEPEVEKKLVVGLLSLVERERDGEMVERDLIKNLIRMMASIGVYAERFERNFVVATGKYYSQEVWTKILHFTCRLSSAWIMCSSFTCVVEQSGRLLADMEIADYLAHVEERLVQEEQRVTHYLEPSTRRPLLTSVENALIASHAEGILQKGFDRLVEQGRVADLARLYGLYSRVQSLPLVRVAFNTHIKAAGAEVVNDAERDKAMVQTLLELKVRRTRNNVVWLC
jgi:cullin-4